MDGNAIVKKSEAPPPHPRSIGWLGTTALAMGGSNQSLYLLGALLLGQGSAAVPLLIVGLVLSWAAAFGWTELILMFPNRVGGIAATCAEAFRPYSPVLANLTGVCYWWGWIPTCGLTAILSATAISEWYLPRVPIPLLAAMLVLLFTIVNLCGIRWVIRLALPFATASSVLAFLSGLVPIVTDHVNWQQAVSFHLVLPFPGIFGGVTSAMAGLYLVGFAAPAFEAAACHVGETVDPARNVPRAMFASGLMATLYFVCLPVVWLGALGITPLEGDLAQTLGPTFAPLFGNVAHAAAIWFMMFNMFHGTLQPLAGAARTLSQLAEDGLLPRVLARRSRTDAPWVATTVTAGMAIVFLLIGDPTWLIAAANLTYLIGICLPNVAVWLLRRFLPTFWRTLEFESTPGGRPTLHAVQFLQRIEGRPRASLQAAPRAVIPRAWQRYVLPRSTSAEDGQRTPRVDRPAYTVCVVERLHEALRRHDIYVEPSERWGDARAKLLQPEQWEGIRAQICQTLGRETAASRALEQLGQQVEEAYQRVAAHLPTNTALQIEQQDGVDVPNLERLERVAEPESLRLLRESIGASLPLIDLPEVILEVAHVNHGCQVGTIPA